MSLHDHKIRMRHMLDHSQEAVQMVVGRCRNDLDNDRMLELSLVRLVEIVGEAASRLEPDKRVQYPSIPWPKIVGMRQRLVHGYDK